MNDRGIDTISFFGQLIALPYSMQERNVIV